MMASDQQWQSIRPWIHRFALSVNQVSSVSATFTLKSALTAKPLDPGLEALLENEGEGSAEHRAPRAVSDALAQGLSVKVNDTAWQRVLLRVEEETDEAIIIVFGLMPGRQYDVELGISLRQEPLRSNFTTDNAPPDRTIPNPNPDDENDENGSTATPIVLSTDITPANIPDPLTTPRGFTPSPSPSPTGSPTLSPSTSGPPASSVPTPSISLEDKVQQLNQSLSLLQSERDSLSVSLKSARRDAQKADAAIRADIDILKRASDKFASVEHRARQKVLALQEAVKQTLAAAADANTAVTDVESSMPGLREQQTEAEKEFEIAKRQASQAREEREGLECQEKRRIDGLQTELVGLGGKLEKLNGKREKLENTVIPDLEEELRRIEEEIAKAAGPFSSPVPDRFDDPYYCDPAPFGVTNKSGSIPATSNPGGFSDDLHLTGQDPLPGLIENTRRRKHLSHPSLTPKPQPQVQILRPSPQQQQARPTPTPNGHKHTATGGTTTSTLSSLAVPFEPSPKRQAQLQSTLGTSLNSSNITSALKAELNSTANVFAPRMGFTPSSSSSSTSATPNSTSVSRKLPGASPNNSNPGHPVWSRGNQKPRRSDVE